MNKPFGLLPLQEDKRDFALGGVFGDSLIDEVPKTDFFVAKPIAIRDQGESDMCTAFASCAVSEDQEGLSFLPEYQFFSTKRITGNNEEWGADLRSACKSLVKYGSIPVKLYGNMCGKPREYVLDSKNWNIKEVDTLALLYKKQTYFSVTGSYDTFDNIRCALWKHRDTKSSIVTGAIWRNAWTHAPKGIIPTTYEDTGFGHAFKIFGQKVIDGELYLVAQLSNGDKIGDGGIFYFNREVTNKEIGSFGLYMFKDIDRNEAEFFIHSPYTIDSPKIKVYLYFISNLIKNIWKFWKK